MHRRNLKKGDQLSLAQLLDGSMSALLALPAGTSLEPKDLHNDSKLSAVLQNCSSEQKQAVELIQIAEMQLLTRSYTAACKTCNQLYSLLEGFYGKRRAAVQQHALLKRVFDHVCVALGDYLLRHSLAEEALMFYEEVSKRNPQDTSMLKKKGRLFYISGTSGLSEAERLYRKAVKLDPRDLDNFENLGRVMEAWGDREKDAAFVYREALSHCRSELEYIRFYRRLYALFPGDTDVVLRLGKLYRRLGMFSQARRYLEETWERSANAWVALDLAWLYLLTNELRRGAALLNALDVTATVAVEGVQAAEAFHWKKSYLVGLVREEEGDFAVAAELFGAVKPPAKVYWPAQAGLVRLALYGGQYADAEEILRKIPASQRTELEQDYFELCRLMEETMAAEHPIHAAAWCEDSGKVDPHYQLKMDIYRRSMGSAFWRKYEIIDLLGNGPASQVYLGRERARGGKMVIKLLHGEILRDPQVVRRIQGRLKLMRTVDQPGLLFPEGDCYYNGDLYYAMGYMEGGNLAERLKHAPLPLDYLMKLARELLIALDYLYRYKKALFHGNIKPENILFDREGCARISDFDLLETIEGSKIFSSAAIRDYSAFKRTFLYAAPERFNWKSSLLGFIAGRRLGGPSPEMALEGVDHRADLYSLGVIFYEMATGFLPCGRADLKSLRSYHRSTAISRARRLNPAIPEALDEAITGLLQKDPRQRFSTPAAALDRLGNATQQLKIQRGITGQILK